MSPAADALHGMMGAVFRPPLTRPVFLLTTIFAAILTPFLGAAFSAYAARLGRSASSWVAAVVAALALALLAPQMAAPFAGETVIQTLPWLGHGLDLSFRLDGLALLFAGLILGIGLLVLLYARYYLSPRDSLGRLNAYLLLFMGSMLGIVLSENVIQLAVFWELTSLSSFLLIAYWRQRDEARHGARMALAITGMGGFALFGGLILLGQMAGSYELSVILASGDVIRAHPLYGVALALILLGVFTKSAQFPFHFWLPHAMAAPTPVSAYLHSATMVKAGVFLLARLYPALSGTPEWFWAVSGAGLATLLVGATVALFKHDLKGLLAYSTISHLGLITLLFGLSTPLAAVAAVFHIINHAIFKASLFMAAGIIDHEAGTRDMRRLSGLWHFMPYTATLAMVAAASMAGVPLMNGFLSKEMFFAEAVDVGGAFGQAWVLPALVTLAGALAVAYSIRFIHAVFFGPPPTDLPKTPHEPPRWMKVPVEVLVVLVLVVGIAPALTVAPLLAVAAQATLQTALPDYHLALWHGVNAALLMSLVALAAGWLIYRARAPLFRLHAATLARFDARRVFNGILAGLQAGARAVTHALDNTSLQRQVAVLVAAALLLGAMPWLAGNSPLTGTRALMPADGTSVLGAGVVIVAALLTVAWARARLAALLSISVVGLFVALIFVKFSAPDLALTQLAVEVVTIVLLLLALYFLPWQGAAETCRLRLGRDAVLALAAGGATALLTWAVLTRPYDSIAGYFLDQSMPGGGGKNVVNVILVDFRGYDTLGEITVLALAGLGIYALLENLRLNPPDQDAAGRPWSRERYPVIFATLAKLLLPLALTVALYILLRGHNAPGGGFIAGLVAAVALIVQYLAHGGAWMRERLPAETQPVIAAGLAVASLTGLASWGFGYPFLTSTFGHVHAPVVGDFELASAMAFDLGVFLVVVGASLLILVNLGGLHDTKTGRTWKP